MKHIPFEIQLVVKGVKPAFLGHIRGTKRQRSIQLKPYRDLGLLCAVSPLGSLLLYKDDGVFKELKAGSSRNHYKKYARILGYPCVFPRSWQAPKYSFFIVSDGRDRNTTEEGYGFICPQHNYNTSMKDWLRTKINQVRKHYPYAQWRCEALNGARPINFPYY